MGTVYPRKNKLWIAYTDASGKRRQQSTGQPVGQEKKAREALRHIEERIEAGLDLGERELGPVTVRRYAERWIQNHEEQGLASAKTARFYMAHAVRRLGDMKIADVRRRHVLDLVRYLVNSGERVRGEGMLAKRTIRHVYFTLRAMFEEAVDERLLDANPCQLRRGQLPKVADKNPLWRRDAQFSRDELEVLVSLAAIPQAHRVAHALEGLAGLRPGEASALRWRCWAPEMKPLGRLDIVAAYDSNNDREKATKTETPREVPVHPVLAKILSGWKLTGWRELTGRSPGPDDLVIPWVDGDVLRFRHKDEGLAALCEATDDLGWRRRRQYDLRRTFVSLARVDGARVDLLKWISHGPPKSVIDGYTSLPWETLCEQVACLKVQLREGAVLTLPKAATLGGRALESATPLLHRVATRGNYGAKVAGELGFEPR